MPHYELFCQTCNRPFSKTLTPTEYKEGTIVCPRCGSEEVVQRWFYSVTMPLKKEIQRRPQKTILGMDLWSFVLIAVGLLIGLASLILLGGVIVGHWSLGPPTDATVIWITFGDALCQDGNELLDSNSGL